MLGTKCTIVTLWRSIARNTSPGSLCASGGNIATCAPAVTHPNNSHTDTSNVVGVFCRRTSPDPSAAWSRSHRSRFTTLPCSTATPFGRPVEPEV